LWQTAFLAGAVAPSSARSTSIPPTSTESPILTGSTSSSPISGTASPHGAVARGSAPFGSGLERKALLDGEAEALARTAIDKALLDGEAKALRLCLDRIAPPRRDRPVAFALPKLEEAAEVVQAHAALVAAVAASDLTPSEAAELSKLLDGYVQAIEAADIQERLTRLEAQAR